ncbi:uncharacterized protein Dvir_GJ14952, isoform C [Drosophila virilis]|uniref:Uncharacterized protein, isoform C n=1 Tax=Drosophila virilis TaxID=7244 RepID=B4MFC7_DROVI|nr:uncharacterized protein Dvir_GJ14952, isoform C [Drosophila virilis]
MNEPNDASSGQAGLAKSNQMDKLSIAVVWPITLCICLINFGYVQGSFLRFTNITCESKDLSTSSIEYCYVGHLDRLRNYMSVRYKLVQPLQKDFFFRFRLMIRNRNSWQPFLYAIDIDLCRFWKTRYNGLAKMLYGLIEGHTNLNHTCPYLKEKYVTIDRVLNTDISKKIRGLPLGKGHYAVFTSWSWKNTTRAITNIYLEVLND